MNAVELAERAGLTYKQVDFWTRTGLLKPANPDCGSGRQRDYPPAEVRVAVLMGRLMRAGLTVQAASRVARGDRQSRLAIRQALEEAS